jgi:hypothetical protein
MNIYTNLGAKRNKLLAGRIAAVMLDEVDLEEAGRFLGVLEPGEDGDGAVEEADGLGAGGSADFHPQFRLSQEPVDGTGAGFFEFAGEDIGQVDPFFPALFDDFDGDGLAVQEAELYFSDTVKFKDGVFPAFGVGERYIFVQDPRFSHFRAIR